MKNEKHKKSRGEKTLSKRAKRRKENKEAVKMLLICETKGNHCEQLGFKMTVGNKENLYCCADGFKQSLEDFKKSITN